MSLFRIRFLFPISLSLLFFALSTFYFLLSPVVVSASFGADKAADFAKQANTEGVGATETDINVMAAKIAKATFSIGGIIFFLLIFYGGYTWLMARGEEEQVQKAQNIIIAAIIGLFIMVGSYAITNFVLNKMINKTGGSIATDTPSDTGDTSPWGCCLDEAKFPNSTDILLPEFLESQGSHWYSSVEHKNTCEKVICKTCSDEDELCGSENCLFYSGITDQDQCDKLKPKD